MKYQGTAKHERNQKILRMAEEHPEMPLAAIGKAFGLSAARIAAIIKRERIPPERRWQRTWHHRKTTQKNAHIGWRNGPQPASG